MRRPILLTLSAVGGIVVLLGGTGLFAALSDTARGQTNSVESGALVASADIQIALASVGAVGTPVTCKTFSEDLTAAITVTGPPGVDTGQVYPYCLRNVGSRTVTLSVLAEDINDMELGCTGDESLYDNTCGTGPGELGDFVAVQHQMLDCSNAAVLGSAQLLVRDNGNTPSPLGTVGPGETRCFNLGISGSSATEVQRQAAQSDRLEWRFAWTGQA